jgi:hypothetical protein
MAPQKFAKNLDASGDDSNPNADVLSDTTPRVTDAIKSWKQFFDILEHEIINCPNNSDEEVDESFSSKIKFVAQSELHKIIARTIIIPYNDTINSDLEHINIQTISVINQQQTALISFRLKNLQVMYNISPTPKYNYNVDFLLDFERRDCTQYGRNGHDIIKTWWGHP